MIAPTEEAFEAFVSKAANHVELCNTLQCNVQNIKATRLTRGAARTSSLGPDLFAGATEFGPSPSQVAVPRNQSYQALSPDTVPG